MSAEKAQLLIIKGAISELPPGDQIKVQDVAARFRAILAEGGHAVLALALVGAEIAAEEKR